MRKRKSQPWFQDVLHRACFEAGAPAAYKITGHCNGRSISSVVTYQVIVPVPEYETRKVRITLYNSFTPIFKGVTADGPTASPHRYSSSRLCMWHPSDPPARRWVAQDGLLQLILHARMHLFREAYWRETGKWLGEQAPHGAGKQAA